MFAAVILMTFNRAAMSLECYASVTEHETQSISQYRHLADLFLQNGWILSTKHAQCNPQQPVLICWVCEDLKAHKYN